MDITSLSNSLREKQRDLDELMELVGVIEEVLPPEKPSMLYFYTGLDYPGEEEE